MKIGIIGMGFVGLTTALGMAYKGYLVNCFDIDKKKISKLKKGINPALSNSGFHQYIFDRLIILELYAAHPTSLSI